jgi:hypothetical protein
MIFINFIRKLFEWLFLLFSDSKFASTRRFIGIQAFYNLVIFAILGFVYKQKLANIELIMQLASYNFTIAMATIIGTTITDMSAIIKNSQLGSKEPLDAFSYSKDEYTDR